LKYELIPSIYFISLFSVIKKPHLWVLTNIDFDCRFET
jgi:hypothetical protein